MLDVKDFESEVIEASREQPVLVDFWAPWCGPCRIIGPVLEKLASEADGQWRLAKVNTDEQPAVASRFRISSIPAVKLFVDGAVTAEFVGALPEPRVRAWLDENLPSKTKRTVEDALAAFEEGDAERALALVTEALAEEPGQPDATMLLARLTVLDDRQRARDLARDAARAKPALIPVGQAVDAVAALIERAGSTLPAGTGKEHFQQAIDALSRSDFDAAIEALIEVIRRDRRYDDDAARKAVLALFAVLGERHPVTRRHRRAFDMAVF